MSCDFNFATCTACRLKVCNYICIEYQYQSKTFFFSVYKHYAYKFQFPQYTIRIVLLVKISFIFLQPFLYFIVTEEHGTFQLSSSTSFRYYAFLAIPIVVIFGVVLYVLTRGKCRIIRKLVKLTF